MLYLFLESVFFIVLVFFVAISYDVLC